MEILIHVGGLFLTFFVLQHYMMLGTHSRAHRLLPLVLGLIALYDFYEIVECITKQHEVFTLLEDLLIIQFLYVMLHYFIEFMRMRWPLWVEIPVFFSLLTANGCMIYQAYMGHSHKPYYYGAAFFYSFLLAVVVGIVFFKYSYSKRQHFVSSMLYLASILPWTALSTRHWGPIPPQIVMTLALGVSCIIIFYLLITDRFVDSDLYMQENIYQSSDNALILLDTDCYFLNANQEAFHLLPEVLEEVKREQERSVYIIALKEYLTGQRETLLWEKKGVFYRGHMTPVMHRGRLKGYVLTMFDITPQMQEIQESEKEKEEARYQTVLKSRFMARMSHDLRSPLHAILGISDILISRKDILSKERGLLLQIRHAGTTLLEMVNAILDYSKLEAGRLELKPEPYELRPLLEDVMADHAIQTVNRPIVYLLRMQTKYPKVVCGDVGRVREILQNVLSNAVKFTKEGSIICDVFCEEVPQEHRVRLKCSVSDTGPGMNETQLQQIFSEYVSFADSKTLEGSGLGLCIVQQLTALMDGCAYASSDGHSGSCVTVEFCQDLSDDPMIWEDAFSMEGTELLGRPKSWTPSVQPQWQYPDARVLLADDMEVNCRIFKEMASRWKLDITCVEDGREALDLCNKETFDLIFLDLMMPVMTGSEAAREIAKISNAPMIALTADNSVNVKKLCKHYGFTNVLWKPMELDELKECLETYLPQQKREPINLTVPGLYDLAGMENRTGYIKTLQTYVREVTPLLEELTDYAEHDMERFRIKVHGIKGISRQIGRMTAGDQAEIMEMAAKAGHQRYIKRNLPSFLEYLGEVLDDVREEAQLLFLQEKERKRKHSQTTTESEQGRIADKEQLLEQIKEGFRAYDLEQIERGLEVWETTLAEPQEQILLQELREACEEFEYERGLELLKDQG